MSMRCRRFHAMIALDVGGDLPPAEGERLRRHLQSCPACRAFRSEMEASQRQVGRLGSAGVEPERLARVRAAVLARSTAPAPAWALSPLPRFSAIALALVIVAGAVAVLTRRPADSPHLPQQTSRAETARSQTAPADDTAEPPPVVAPAPAELPRQRDTLLAEEALPRQRPGVASAARGHEVHRQPPSATVAAKPPASSDPTLIRLVSDDEAVVIYWLIDPEHETKES